ncbi:MAG TPA: ATP-binding protein [Planctomycetota bacterium]|nr:ATP-binding protein [Planctomycetota bacterium]
MPKHFLLESFEKHKNLGIRCFDAGDLREAKYHFLKAAEYLLELARQSDPDLRKVRTRQAAKLIELAKNLKQRRRAVREKAAARAAGGGAKDDEAGEVPEDWLVAERPKIRFGDIAGLEDVKEQIRVKMIYPFTHVEQAKKYRIRTGGGILLFGPPGTGKTMIAKAVAGELDATFFAIAPSEILNKWVGESEKNIRKLFDAARRCARAVIFIDEVEALTPPRRDGESGGVMQRVVPQILNELDGFDRKEGQNLLFMGATNEPWNIDTAMLRPGRLDEKIYVGLPEAPARRKILEMNLGDVPLDGDVDLDRITSRLEGYSGADIAYLCRKVAEETFLDSVEKKIDRQIGAGDFDRVLLKLKPSVARVDLDRFKKFKAGGV